MAGVITKMLYKGGQKVFGQVVWNPLIMVLFKVTTIASGFPNKSLCIARDILRQLRNNGHFFISYPVCVTLLPAAILPHLSRNKQVPHFGMLCHPGNVSGMT